nr:hypothetical protein [Tanacetum cinerariifolium]
MPIVILIGMVILFLRLETIFGRHVNRVHTLDFKGLTPDMRQDLAERLRMVYTRDDGQEIFVSHAWRRIGSDMGLDVIDSLCFQLGGARRRCERVIPDKGDLSGYRIEISSDMDFLRFDPSYTYIRDPVRRLCHRLIACSIAGRSQTPKKVIVTNLFYLRGMDVGSVNIPYILARYLRLFASGRKQGAMIFDGQFVARLAKHFGLLTKERLQGLTMIVRDLLVINMVELVRLQICMELDDTRAWVASGPERQPDAMTGAPEAAEDAHVADEGALAVPAPVHAPQPPPPAAEPSRTMAHRLARVKEDVHEIQGALGERTEIFDSVARDFSRLSTWTIVGLSQMMTQQDEQQHDP